MSAPGENLLNAPLAPAGPYTRALISQLAGVALALGLAALWVLVLGRTLSIHTWVGAQAVSAAGIALALRMPWWWVGLNLCFVPGLALGLAFSLPPHLAAGVLFMLLLVYGGTQGSRVPLYLSNSSAVRVLIELTAATRPVAVLDLGCGTGTVLRALAQARPLAQLTGVERAPLPCLVAWLRARLSGDRWRVRWGDLWSVDLSGQDVVYAYLSPAAMPRLWNKLSKEMLPGSLFVSFRFPVPGVTPTRVIEVGGSRLYLWRMP